MFPAYIPDSPPRQIASPERDDFSGRYSSFFTYGKKSEKEKRHEQRREERKERRERERKQREKQILKEQLASQHSVKMITFYSDDSDSDIEIPAEAVESIKKKQKRSKQMKDRKEKKRRKEASSSSLSESSSETESSSSSSESGRGKNDRSSFSQILANRKWSFLNRFIPSDPETFMLCDFSGDNSNSFYPSLSMTDVAKYEWLIHRVLAGSETYNRLMFPHGEDIGSKVPRYFDEKVRKSWNKYPERFFRRKEMKPFTDYVALSSYGLDEKDLLDESGRMDARKCSEVSGAKSLIEDDPETKSRDYNKQLHKDRHNIDLWMKFVKIQDEILLAQNNVDTVAKDVSVKLTDRANLERKISILDSAIQYNYDSVKLKLERLKLGMKLWEEEQWRRELTDIQFKHVNSAEMWKGVLDLLESDTRRFNLSSQLTAIKLCLSKLHNVLCGDLITHPSLPGTEEFFASVIRRNIRLLMRAGHTEMAIAVAQAVCEFNLCTPPSYEKSSLNAKRQLFEEFWESGIARIGDIGAKGWANSVEIIRNGTVVTDKEEAKAEQADCDNIEKDFCLKVGPKGQNLPYRLVWLGLENLRCENQWRPIRDVDVKQDDLERVVTINDVRDVLYSLSRPIAISLLFDILIDFGAVIYGRETSMSENIIETFEIFPKLSHRLKSFDVFVERFIEQARSFVQERRDLLLSSQLITLLNFLKIYNDLDGYTLLKRFREEAKQIVSKENNITNLSFMATYAETIYELGDVQKARTCAEKLLKQNMWLPRLRTRLVSCLRLSLILVLSSDEKDKRWIVSSLILNGFPMRMEAADPRGVQKEFNRQLTQLIKEEENGEMDVTWEGSAVDITAALTIYFTYYYTDEYMQLRVLRNLYGRYAVHPKLKATTRPLFMKHFVSLLQNHCRAHPNESRSFLITLLADAFKNNPKSCKFLKQLIDLNALGIRPIRLRRFLEANTDDDDKTLCLAYGAVYLELLRHRILVETCERQMPSLHLIRKVLVKSSERIGHRDDVFWRILLAIEFDMQNEDGIKEAFYMAYSHCPWSKKLLLAYKSVPSGEQEKLLDAMEEKGLRVRCRRDEIPILLQAYAAKQ